MKNSTLLIRSIVVIVILTAVSHLFTLYTTGYSSGSSSTEGYSQLWEGKYLVSFDGMDEQAIYEIRKEGGELKGYSTMMIDANGAKYEDNTLMVSKIKTSSYEAEAKYSIEYEGETYEVNTQLVMDEVGNIVVTYDYYGYAGKEMWVRQ